MSVDWQRVLPVLVSIAIIIAVAILRQYSKTIAAIAATMPLNIPLGLWIIYSGENGNRAGITQFTEILVVSLPATFVFALIAWLAARAGWGVAPMIVAGYAGWGVVLLLSLAARGMLGR